MLRGYYATSLRLIALRALWEFWRLDLNGDLVDAIAFMNRLANFRQQVASLATVVRNDMGRKGVHPRGDAPNMEVMNADHAADTGNGVADFVNVDSPRNAFHEDAN